MSFEGARGHHDCGADETPYCPWWCHVHDKHHPVTDMVTHCESLTDPDVRPESA